MKRVACPHCGFQNFEISAYCGRCERPLPIKTKRRVTDPDPTKPPTDRGKAASNRGTPPPRRDSGKPPLPKVPPPAPPRADLSPMPIENDDLLRAQEEAVYRKAEVRAATANLPEATDVVPELDALEAIEATSALELDSLDAGEIEVPVQLASGWMIALAHLIDAVMVVGAGVGIAALESVVVDTPWQTHSTFLVDTVADWLHAHPGAAIHGAGVALVAGVIYHLLSGRRGGRTLGRSLTGTVLVRTSGRSLTWPILVTRILLSLVSLAFLGAGFFWAFIDRQHRTWHDLIIGTVVVRRRVRLPTTPL